MPSFSPMASDIHSTSNSEEEVDPFDFELPDLEGDLKDVQNLLKLHDTTTDKLLFMVSVETFSSIITETL